MFNASQRYRTSSKDKISILNAISDVKRSSNSRFIYCLLLACLICSVAVALVVHCSVVLSQAEPQPASASLHQSVRIFCVIHTSKERHNDVAVHVKRTWVRQCDGHLFVSNDLHVELEPAVFNGTSNWATMRAEFDYVYRYHNKDGDWFVRAKDDNYVNIENLRYMLSKETKTDPIYFGCKLRNIHKQIYMYMGTAMVFSQAALGRLAQRALPDARLCRQSDADDVGVELSKCLQNVGVVAGESLDSVGAHVFLPFELEVHLTDGMQKDEYKWFLNESFYVLKNSHVPVSKHVIAFHITYMPKIYNINYFVRKVNIFGTMRRSRVLK